MRWVKLEDFTFKDFKEWYMDKKLYGYWTYEVMFLCEDIMKSMRKIAPWNRKKTWNLIKGEIFVKDTVFDIMDAEDIKQKINDRNSKLSNMQ